MVIRNADLEDAPHLLELIHELGYTATAQPTVTEKITAYQQSPHYRLLVAEEDGYVLGFIALHVYDIFHSPGKMGRITALCVDVDERGKGIGSLLLAEAEAFFEREGCSKIEVTSHERRTQAHSFYRNHHYLEDSRRFVRYLRS